MFAGVVVSKTMLTNQFYRRLVWPTIAPITRATRQQALNGHNHNGGSNGVLLWWSRRLMSSNNGGGGGGGSLDNNFLTAQQSLKGLTAEPDNDIKLRLYGLYKQATSGQCTAPKPSAFNMVDRAKWTAWSQLGQLSKSEAMQQYVATVNSLTGADGGGSGGQTRGQQTPNDKEDGQHLLVEKRNGVTKITLNRPDKFNAITKPMYESIASALNDAANDETIKLAVIIGSGKFFSSGNDLSNFEQAFKQFKGDMRAGTEQSAKVLQHFVAAFIDFPKPLIGAVNGPAIGIAVTTLGLMDCAVASDSAYFQTPFSSLGQSPEACATFTFPHIMGFSKASEMLYFNHKMSAAEALQCGLISRIVPSAQFDDYIENWIFGDKGLVNTCYPKSMQCSKQLVKNDSFRLKLHEINKEECDTIKERWISDECLDAIQKFLQKKK
ncbi:enoyl-CoA delta isomerase 2-like [Oppia nitens]|uniref:enoyl-CoA delta isomerase 2-like n=1 Tax=Oppia nitens TaxID=1686743 RepID=UPI0023DBB71B|nr:enoyl-CoA delta isomerase 2-like [Oppia nitens]